MRLLIVSNRLPVTIIKKKNTFQTTRSIGGLTTAFSSYLRRFQGQAVWLGWPGLDVLPTEKNTVAQFLQEAGNYFPVFLDKSEVTNFYEGFSNRTLWPLFHYASSLVELNEAYWQSYQEANRQYADLVAKVYKQGDLILIQDYHLMLVPSIIRKQIPNATIGFFLHIPFPTYEIFRILPSSWREELLRGVLGADLIGFHTEDYTHYFLDNVLRILGVEHVLGKLPVDARTVSVDTFPLGIDFTEHQLRQYKSAVKKAKNKWRSIVGTKKIILSIDRLDYSKGIINRLQGFNHFLQQNAEYRGKVTLVVVVVPSRTTIREYRHMKRNIDELVGEINGQYGTIDWTPIIYQYRAFSPSSLAALYGLADIALLTPLRDGMNLIAKEYIASRTTGEGVLILSEFAGAHKEMNESLIINPNSIHEISCAIKDALRMEYEEQRRRNSVIQERLMKFDVNWWIDAYIRSLQETKGFESYTKNRLTAARINVIRDNYRKAGKRLILLDYDGTLVPFSTIPSKAVPSKNLISLLFNLRDDPQNEVVIVSGRDRQFLNTWFSGIDVTLIGEHGAIIKRPGDEWSAFGMITNSWKPSIEPVMKRYVERLPQSFVEEKEYSLAWHYRRLEMLTAEQAANDLRAELMHLTANLNLQVLQGNKVIEVKTAGITKGTTIAKMYNLKHFDFILAIGDDLTDEDMFMVLPQHAFTFKVGQAPSIAKFHIESSKTVVELLHHLEQKQLITTRATQKLHQKSFSKRFE